VKRWRSHAAAGLLGLADINNVEIGYLYGLYDNQITDSEHRGQYLAAEKLNVL